MVLHKSAENLFLKEGYDDKYGVRELNRTMQRLFENKFASELLRDKYKSGDTIVCSCSDSKLQFRKKSTRKTR